MILTSEQKDMLKGGQSSTKQKAMRLLVDLGEAAGAKRLIPVTSAHVSGVSPLTGGEGLIRFLKDLTAEGYSETAVETTLNSAGCDRTKIEDMDIPVKDYVEKQQIILDAYERLGIKLTLSCTPYDNPNIEGNASWAESNAVCFANSYTKLRTNRESGLSAIATAICGFTPEYGLLLDKNRVPNLAVTVDCDLEEPVDYSILGDWIGKQIQPQWKMEYGPIPIIFGLKNLNSECRKALTAAAANYGCPMLFVDGFTDNPQVADSHADIRFTALDLKKRYSELAPKNRVDLVTIGCPQASYEEIQRTAELVDGKELPKGRLWLFTSSENFAKAEKEGLVKIVEDAGGLVLRETCPEVVHYNHAKIKHILTNSMKAEHYLKSGLNSINTSVMRLADCIEHAAKPDLLKVTRTERSLGKVQRLESRKTRKEGNVVISGEGLKSQEEWVMEGEALVTDVPITFLGFVNRETGTIEEEGHPINGESIADKILIFPKGSGSTVAPYVLLGLFYNGNGPKAIINTDLDQQTIPACSLLGIPYAHSFEEDPCQAINSGDKIRLELRGGNVKLECSERT